MGGGWFSRPGGKPTRPLLMLGYTKARTRAETPHAKAVLAVKVSSLLTFAYLFSTYVSPPQTNLMLLPFFVVVPLSRR